MLAKGKPIAYPELIRAGDWKVREWNPATHRAPCTANNEMFLPAGKSPFAREVKFHELLHVAYSPPNVPDDTGVSQESLLAAEDCRVNVKGARIRPHDAIGTDPNGAPDAFMVASKMSERGLARLTAAMCGYVSTDRILSKLQEDLDALDEVDKLPQWLRDHACDLERVVRNVRRHAPGYVTIDSNEFQDAINLAAWLDTFSDDDTESLSKGKGSDDGDGDYEESPGKGGDSSKARWGDMKIETPPLSVRHRTSIGHRTSPSTEGARMVHFNRLVTGEVYGRTRKRAVPDAVLIDQSGSMHWSAKKLDELVKSMPVGIIAGYCGEGGTGVLRILAKDGRMVAPHDVKAPHGGNEVDGPALRWLARQRGRKVWVSDEGVCSDLSRDDAALAADCREVCDAAGIKVCLSTNPRDIMAALRGMGGKRA